MRSNCCPVCLCADNMPLSYVTPLSTLLTGRRIQQRYMSSFLHLFSRCIRSSIYLFLIATLANYSNPTNVLKFLVALSLSAVAFLLISPVTRHPSCFRCCSSIISKCVRQKLYVLLYDCVYNMAIGSVSAPMSVLTFNLHVLFILFRLVPFLFFPLSYSGFSNHRGSLLPIPVLNVHFL